MRLSFLHRLTALLSSALLLQLSLLASGTLCRMHGEHDMGSMRTTSARAAEHDTDSSRGTPGPLPATMVAVSDASSGMPGGPCDMTGPSKSCDAPWAPGSCSSMATCVTAVSATPTSTAMPDMSPTTFVHAVASAELPLGPAFAPELPPPRA